MSNSTDTSLANNYSFLDSIAASKVIVQDKMEGFFDRISMVDMQIQMLGHTTCQDRADCLVKYHKLLRSEVSDFTASDRKLIEAAMDSAYNNIGALNPKLWTDNIDLIKIKTNHYGPNVYYTRENAILIPDNVLTEDQGHTLYAVMLHEIFHILSRTKPELKKNLYELIGFYKSDVNPVYPESLRKIALTNPDGIDDSYFIELKNGDSSVNAVPVIVSSSPPDPARPSFFGYLHFDLYQMDSDGILKADDQGKAVIPGEYMQSFFDQIKGNTQYIIHPDEIMADNFMLLIMARQDQDYSKFSPNGSTLIKNVEQILESY